MDNIQLIMGLRALADIIECYEKAQATKEGMVRAVDKHFTREFKRIEKLEDDYVRERILQENVNRRMDRERERAAEAAAASASTPTRKKRQRKKSLLRKVQVWVKRKRYAFRKLTRRRRVHAQRTRGSVPAVRKGVGGSVLIQAAGGAPGGVRR